MTVGMVNAKCPECGGTTIKRSTLPGLASCVYCGRVFAPPSDSVGLTEDVGLGEATDVPETMQIEAPDAVECVYGWRGWLLREPEVPGELALLQSRIHTAAYWTPRVPMVASCDRGQYHRASKKNQHDPPGEGCSCGLYSAKTYQHLLSLEMYHTYDQDRSGQYGVVGKVKLWGGVIEGTLGWRAGIGYPEELYLPYEAWHLHTMLEESYGVNVYLKNFLAD